MARGSIRKGTAAVAAGGVLFWAAAALSQQTTASTGKQADTVPPRLVFDLSSGVNLDTNRALTTGPKESSATLDTRLGLSYSAKTRLQSFDFGLKSLWRLGKAGKQSGRNVTGNGLQEPEARLSYGYDDGENRLTLKGRYRKSQVNVFEPLVLSDGTLSPTDLIATSGSVIAWGANLGFTTGLRDPIGFNFTASTDRRHYLQNTDPSVYDSRTNVLGTGLRFTLDPLSQINVNARVLDQRYDNTLRTHRRQRQLSLGYQRALSPILTFNGEIGYSRNRTEYDALGGLKQQSNGLYGSLGLVRKMPNGTASVTLAASRDSIGQRNTLQVGRALALPTGKIDAEAGVSMRPGYGAQFIGRLAYALEGPVDSFSANLSRAVALDANNNDIAYTAVGLGYSRKLTRLASVGVDLNVSHSGSGGIGSASRIDRQSVKATYSYALTQDWNFNAGYLFRHLNKSTAGNATSNSVFFNVGRKFTLWP